MELEPDSELSELETGSVADELLPRGFLLPLRPRRLSSDSESEDELPEEPELLLAAEAPFPEALPRGMARPRGSPGTKRADAARATGRHR